MVSLPTKPSTPSMIYLRVQPVRKQLAARRATAGLAVANSRERNNAESLPHERSECFGSSLRTAPALANLGRSAPLDISLKEY
jgi:hypothetical protein